MDTGKGSSSMWKVEEQRYADFMELGQWEFKKLGRDSQGKELGGGRTMGKTIIFSPRITEIGNKVEGIDFGEEIDPMKMCTHSFIGSFIHLHFHYLSIHGAS